MSQQYGMLERTGIAAVQAIYATRMAMPPKRDVYPQFPGIVTRVRALSPAFRRVTIAAPDLATITRTGPDEYLGLYLPGPGETVHLPANALDPRRALAELPPEQRPDLRWYTIRAHRPADAEIDVDIVCTGHDGPGARWIARVCVDDEVGVRIQAAPYGTAPASGHHLLLADETGLPGLLAILDAHGAQEDRRFSALVEVPDEDHLHDEVGEAGVHVVFRGRAQPGHALLAALRGAALDPVDYAWVCAEAGTVAACKRHLIKERHVGRRAVMGSGFWKVGRARL